MAAEVSGLPNGNYGLHQQSYNGGNDQNNFSYSASNQNSLPPTAQSSATSSSAQPQQTPQPDIPKDEVGWYFVEQYYTTLSRTPEKLYLFYNKRSQFVSGQETDKVAVCVGQRAINDKIRDLDFNDCKVRVTNVDSQASDSNIVIQVIGELSNRGQPHKKFTQTFVLATQTNGYFVLNDIFRYLVEEEDEAEAEAQQPQEEVQQVSGTENGVQESAPAESQPATLPGSADPVVVETAAEEADKKIEEKLVNGTKPEAEKEETPAVEEEKAPAPAEEKAEEVVPAAQPEPEAEPPKELEKTATAEADVEQETPNDPEPTRAPTPPKQEAQKPAAAPAPKPAAPAVPKTWASLAASAAKTISPAVPQPVVQAAKNVQQKAAAAIPAAPAAAISNAITPNVPSAPSSQNAKGNDSQDEWTAVGSNHNRNASKQTNAAPQQQEPQYRGYIKNVADNVEVGKLKAELEKFGEVTYFDIARQKNCAFVDFKTAEGYNKAKASQFEVEGNDVPLFVEERKFRPGSTPYIPRGQYQGGRGGPRGGASQGAPRGNFQGGRGGQGQGAPRGRGNYAAAGQRGGRGGAQA